MHQFKRILTIIVLVTIYHNVYSQNIKQLAKQLNQAHSDTAKVSCLRNISIYYANKNSIDSALLYTKYGLHYANRSKNKTVIAKVNLFLSDIYYQKNDYAKALSFGYNAMRSYEQIHDSIGIIKSYIKVASLLQSKNSLYKAEQLLNKALVISKLIKNDDLIYNILSDLAGLYSDKKENEKAINTYEQVINYYYNQQNEPALRQSYNNLAVVYYRLGNYSKNKEYLLKAYNIAIKSNNKLSSASNLINLGIVETKLKNYTEALDYLKQAQIQATEQNEKEGLMYVYGAFDEVYKARGNYKKAHEALNSYITLYSELNDQQTNEAFNNIKTKYEVENKELELKAKQQQKEIEYKIEKAKQVEQLKFQRWIIGLSIFGIALLIGVVFLVIRNLKRNKKASAIITLQKAEIEHKHQETTDSINYAKRIQDGLLATEQTLQKNFENYFMLFKPKDIVSGDFYWGTEYQGVFYFSVCDSTGHGVPGAFMSLLNISLLSEAIKERHITEPHLIFNEVRMRLSEIIVAEGNKDGFDGVLIKKQGHRLEYVAANNELILIRNGEILKMPSDRMPVGKSDKANSFTAHVIELQKDDCVYLYTDGYPDQFGGSKGKKFMSKKLKELLLANAHLPMSEQKKLLDSMFNEWIGNLEQTDDVTIFGFKV